MFCRSPRFLRQLVLAVHALVCFKSLRMSNLESNLFGSNGFQRFLHDDVEPRWTTLNHVEPRWTTLKRWQCWTSVYSFCSEMFWRHSENLRDMLGESDPGCRMLPLRWHVFMIARFAIGTFSSVLEDLLTVTSCLFMPLHASSCLTSVTSVTSCLNFEDALDWSPSDNVRRFGSFCMSQLQWNFLRCATKKCRMCSWRTFCSWKKTHLWRRQSKGKARAKQGQSKSKGLEFDIVRSKRCYNGQLISADISWAHRLQTVALFVRDFLALLSKSAEVHHIISYPYPHVDSIHFSFWILQATPKLIDFTTAKERA